MRLPSSLIPVALLCALSLAGCASAPPQTSSSSTGQIRFPGPPAKPVIEWLSEIHSAQDVGAGPGKWQKIITGEEQQGIALQAPTAVAIAPDQTLYVVDPEQDTVFVINQRQKLFEAFNGTAGNRLLRPIGVAVGPNGKVYISDIEHKAVFAYSPQLELLASWGGPSVFERPTNLALNRDGSVLAVCDTRHHEVFLIDTTAGELVGRIGGGGDESTALYFPVDAAFDEEGFLYVADLLNFRIQVFDPAGEPELIFGAVGDRPGNLNRPRGVAADAAAGVVYEVDSAFERVQMFNLDGELLMWFGSPGQGPGQFQLPTGIALRGDLIAVADTLNERIQLFRFLGAPEVAAAH